MDLLIKSLSIPARVQFRSAKVLADRKGRKARGRRHGRRLGMLMTSTNVFARRGLRSKPRTVVCSSSRFVRDVACNLGRSQVYGDHLRVERRLQLEGFL